MEQVGFRANLELDLARTVKYYPQTQTLSKMFGKEEIGLSFFMHMWNSHASV